MVYHFERDKRLGCVCCPWEPALCCDAFFAWFDWFGDGPVTLCIHVFPAVDQFFLTNFEILSLFLCQLIFAGTVLKPGN